MSIDLFRLFDSRNDYSFTYIEDEDKTIVIGSFLDNDGEKWIAPVNYRTGDSQRDAILEINRTLDDTRERLISQIFVKTVNQLTKLAAFPNIGSGGK